MLHHSSCCGHHDHWSWAKHLPGLPGSLDLPPAQVISWLALHFMDYTRFISYWEGPCYHSAQAQQYDQAGAQNWPLQVHPLSWLLDQPESTQRPNTYRGTHGWVGSADEGVCCCQVWCPEFDPWNSLGRVRELVPAGCPLTSMYRPWHVCTQISIFKSVSICTKEV